VTVLDILTRYRADFFHGLAVTLKLCLLIWPIGIVLGTLLGVAGYKWKRSVGLPTQLGSFVMSGIPILVLLFWLHYPLQALLGVVIDPFVTAVAALSLVNMLLVADLVRSVLGDFPSQYILAARVHGLSSRQTVLHVQLPIIFRQVLPGVLVIQVSMLQATLFASLISVDEIFRICQRINSEIYRPVEIYSTLALFFLAVCLPLHGLANWMRRKFTRDYSEK
jgi:polar amino acid transport system permease protein